ILCLCFFFVFFFFFKQKTAYDIMPSLVGSEMCIRDRFICPPLLPFAWGVDGTGKYPREIYQSRALRHNLGAQERRDRCSSTPGSRVARASRSDPRDGHLNDGFPEVC